MEDALKKDIRAVVASIFSEKEEADMREQTEKALQESAETIDELTTALETSKTATEEANDKIVTLEEANKDLEGQLEAAGTEKSELETQLEEAKAALEEIKKDQLAKERMASLEEAGVARKDAEVQTAKVREMNDEEFASYKEELEEVRASIMETVKPKEDASDDTSDDDSTDTSENASDADDDTDGTEAASEEENSDDDATPPANINPAHAAQAALNMEVRPSEDVMSKYAKLGAALAGIKDKE